MDDQVTEFMDDDSQDGNSPLMDNEPQYDPDPVLNTAPATDPNDNRSMGQPLSDFLMTLEDYTPTVNKTQVPLLLDFINYLYFQIPDAVTNSYLASAGFQTSDPRMYIT